MSSSRPEDADFHGEVDDDDEEYFDNEDDDEIFETMDDCPMKIVPGLFIGSFMAEQNKVKLQKAGITHVLQVAEGMCPSHPSDFTYCMVAVQDHPSEDLVAHFPRAFAFIDSAIGHLHRSAPGALPDAGTSAGNALNQAPAAGATPKAGYNSGPGQSGQVEASAPVSSRQAMAPSAGSISLGKRSGGSAEGGTDKTEKSDGGLQGEARSCQGPQQAQPPSSATQAVDLAELKGGVLVHCVAGVSRSATICIGWLMWKYHLTYDAAFRKVHAVRPWVMPNMGFRKQLHEFEELGYDPAKWRAWRHRHPEQAGAVVSLHNFSSLGIAQRQLEAMVLEPVDDDEFGLHCGGLSGGADLLSVTRGLMVARDSNASTDSCGLGTSF